MKSGRKMDGTNCVLICRRQVGFMKSPTEQILDQRAERGNPDSLQGTRPIKKIGLCVSVSYSSQKDMTDS